jgi:hypothetical protein
VDSNRAPGRWPFHSVCRKRDPRRTWLGHSLNLFAIV